jgi:hypothetical protein
MTNIIDIAAPLTMVLAEMTGTETGGRLASAEHSAQPNAIYYLPGLNLIGQSDGVSMEYFTYDGLGSVRQVVDGAGDVLYGQGFDPYGNTSLSAGNEKPSWGWRSAGRWLPRTAGRSAWNLLVETRARQSSSPFPCW